MSLANFEMHRRFLAALGAGYVPDDLASWYAEAYRRSIDTGEPLDVCLGLRGPGIRTPATRERLEQRNALLLLALAEIDAPGLWQKCDVLADRVKRWPRSRHEAPILAQIFKMNINIPKSTGGIYAAVEKIATQ